MAMTLRSLTTTIGLAAGLLAAAPLAHAFNFGDMFNPGRWMGGGDDYDDYYYDGPYGPYGGGPYGGGPWGAPYGGYGPYGAPGYGYGAAPYGYAPGIAPGYAAPAPAPAAPAAGSSDAKDQEIEALKRRIDQLESRQAPPSGPPSPSAGGGDWPSAPAFRPMDQY